jgi:hypothetical protein
VKEGNFEIAVKLLKIYQIVSTKREFSQILRDEDAHQTLFLAWNFAEHSYDEYLLLFILFFYFL